MGQFGSRATAMVRNLRQHRLIASIEPSPAWWGIAHLPLYANWSSEAAQTRCLRVSRFESEQGHMDYTKYHRDYYYKRRKRVYDYLGGKCVLCGASEDLEIDHIDRAAKSFNVSERLSLTPDARAELDKCQLLCATHHREKTSRENSGFTHGTMYGWMKKRCNCSECSVARNAYNVSRIEQRSVASHSKRGPYNLQAEHGTRRCYSRGCRCAECRSANAAAERARTHK